MKGYRLLILGLLATLLTGCSLDDDRDECCYQVRLHFHETIDGVDRFRQDIKSMRHLLFDKDGNFLEWLPSPANNPQDVDISDLANGDYTVVTVANATDKTLFEDYDHISTFRLRHNGQYAGTRAGDANHDNSDELYWHMVSFTISNEEKEISCPLANIHCHLHVRAEWKGIPQQHGKWTMRLFGVPTEFQAGEAGLIIKDIAHPVINEVREDHQIEADTFNFELEVGFITCRWTNSDLPVLQIWCDDEPASPRMDLERAFQEWGWYPDRALIQDYWIELLIGRDGSVDMRASGEANVSDWIDGGTIGY